MQICLLIVLGTGTGLCMRRIAQWRRLGYPRRMRRLYARTAWCIGGGLWLCMAAQETLLLLDGKLTLQSGLPLHLCSALGVTALPMLLTGNRFLWHSALYLGMPGAVLALLFPAVAASPWQEWMNLAFFGMHCLLALAPLLPLSLGKRPEPSGALHALAFITLLGAVDLCVNALLNSNYLFLSLPAHGTPLALLAGGGVWAYRAALLGLCTIALTVEAAAAFLWKYRLKLR